MSIFIQMTAYKNFEVLQTVRDCIEKSKNKDDLHFGIVLQQDEDVPVELNHERIRVHKVPIKDSNGHGWARSVAQSMYNGQDFTLQIDTGCRFAAGWDQELIQALAVVGSERPMITNPANKFNTANGELENIDVAYKLQAFQFLFDTPSFWPIPMKGAVAPSRARNVSDHFMFTQGRHCVECPYDPSLYYSEVECATTLRSFTLGYDIFHYHKPFVFRNYAVRPMNWNDDSDWWLKDRTSKASFGELIKGNLTNFGLGSARTARDFELYSGIDFAGRRLQRDTVAGAEPPCKFVDDATWEAGYMKDYSIVASWDNNKIENCEDLDYWLFAIEDASGAVINRQDLRWERDKPALEKRISAKRVFFKAASVVKPARLVIQPHSKSKGALERVTFDL